MAITVGDKLHNVAATTSPRSVSFTNNQTTNNLLVVGIEIRSATARAGGAPTYGGVAMTQVGTVSVNATGLSVEMWYLTGALTGANTLSVPNTGTLTIALDISSWSGVAASPLGASANANGSSVTPSVAVSAGAGALVIDVMDHESTNASTIVEGTVLFSTDEGVWNSGAHYIIEGGATTQTMSWTNSLSDIWATKAAAFNPYIALLVNSPTMMMMGV